MSDRAEMLAERIWTEVGMYKKTKQYWFDAILPILRAALDVPPAPASPVDVEALALAESIFTDIRHAQTLRGPLPEGYLTRNAMVQLVAAALASQEQRIDELQDESERWRTQAFCGGVTCGYMCSRCEPTHEIYGPFYSESEGLDGRPIKPFCKDAYIHSLHNQIVADGEVQKSLRAQLTTLEAGLRKR